MCKWIKSGNTRIDPCMRGWVNFAKDGGLEVLACCCGHGKYSRTIVIDYEGHVEELFSKVIIPRKKRFYKRDSEGHFYIPEMI
jgi:hypothetical protein